MRRKRLSYISFDENETSSPMDGVSNMSDAMLVLAVGIMLALVLNWKIDINTNITEKIDIKDNMQEFETSDKNANNSVSIEDVENKYVKSGTVYTDTETGKTYVVIED